MEIPSDTSPSAWDEAEPLLDEAVSRLGTSDRDAILLRFFQNKSHKEIASGLGTTEDGARKRVTRAVEKLRSFFAQKGILISVAVLGEALSSHSLRAAPEGLGSVIKTLARPGKASVPAAVTAMISEALREMAWFKARIALGAAGGVVAIAVVAQLLWQTGNLPATSANERSANQTAAPTSGISPVLLAQAGTDASTQETMVATHLLLRVVDAADGHALAGARMIVTYWGRTDTNSPRIDLTTDVEGKAEVPLAGKEFSLVRVWISGEGHAPKVIDWHRYEFNRRPAEYLVRLEHGLILAGVVEDESGQSVSGARLQTTGPGLSFSSRENIGYHPDLSQVITDTAGRWFFRQAPFCYDSLTFSVSHPDFAKTSATLPLSGSDTTNAVIVLSRGVTLAGRVVNTNGEAIAGATVREDGGPEASNKTDEAGMFKFAHVNPGPFRLNAKAVGYRPLTRTVLGSTNAQEIRLVLAPSAGDPATEQNAAPETKTIRLAGKASDSETGQPIERFDVLLVDRDGPWEFAREGRFMGEGHDGVFEWRYPVQSLSGYSIEVKAEGYAPEVSQKFKVSDGDQLIEFKLKRDNGISGQAVFPDGTPAAGAEVFLAGKGFGPASVSTPLKKHVRFPNGGDMSLRQFTDSEGRFHFQARLSANRVVVVHDFGCAAVLTNDLATSPVVLEPWGRIEGTIRSGGSPAANHHVMASQAPLGPVVPQVPYSRTATSDSEGRLVFERVPPGKLELARLTNVHGDQPGPIGLSHHTTVDVKPGETAHAVIGGGGRAVVGRIEIIGHEFLAHWPSEMQSLVGEPPGVAPPTMQPGGDFSVFARSMAKYERQVPKYFFPVRSDGSFSIEDVSLGAYRLNIRFTEPPEDPLDQEWMVTHDPSTMVSLDREIIVPESTGGLSDESVNVGVFSVLVSDAQPPQD